MKALLQDAIDDYLILRGSQDYGKGTKNNERGVLRRFVTVNGNIWTHSISERHVIRHFEDAAKTRQASTLQLDHSTLSQFFDWARRSRRMAMDNDPMVGRRRPKVTKRERDRIHVSQFANLLDLAGEVDPRNRMVVAIFLYTLIRDQEAADLRVGDVDLEGGWLTVRVTKSHQEDRMPISAEFDTELRAWLTHYTEAVGLLGPDRYLLPRRQSIGVIQAESSGRITGHEVVYSRSERLGRPSLVVTQALEAAGFAIKDHAGRAKGEGSHTLRRSGARALFDQLSKSGYDNALRIVQSMLHHSSIATTERYIGITADRRNRDEIIRGQQMYKTESANVVRLTV